MSVRGSFVASCRGTPPGVQGCASSDTLSSGGVLPTVAIHDSFQRLDPAAWDELVGEASPFLESTFLFATEQTGAACPDTGWTPRPVTITDDAGTLVAAAPAWIKSHSMGEFVYDHGWARGAQQAGYRYYPKTVVAVPFTPVTGSRLVVRAGEDRARWIPLLLAGLQEVSKNTHGLHILFNPAEEARELEAHGTFSRLQYQFMWRNEGYGDYDDFLARFKSRARKKLRRERREVGHLRIERVLGLDRVQIDRIFDFYRSTCTKLDWGTQYLERDFFRHLADSWGERLLGVFAWDGDTCVAGALDVVKGDRLYGRYWGCLDEVKFLHFEVCYHQGIEFCIERGLRVFEPGHGGSHKYRRGFLPALTWSSHLMRDPRLHSAFADFCQREGEAVRAQATALGQAAPFADR